jgi:hypothetical protein
VSVFTLIGLLFFWCACFRLGYLLGWCADSDGILVGVARVLVGMDEIRVSMHDLIPVLQARDAS